MASRDYLPSIGIETHVQLKTKTKLFSAVSNDAREAKPNSLISHIDAGLPGALPVLNEEAVRLTVLAGLSLHGEVQPFSRFDRKHYFYPDLPKGYQISQYQQPIVIGGGVDIMVGGKPSRIGLVRVHLEEDAGKNTHPDGADYTLVDLNRAGTPLIEIVSQPDIHSPAEAKAFVRELYLIVKYAGVSDADLYHGNIRFDINVSLSDKPGQLGIRSEVKNLNSFRSVEYAAAYEIDRQTKLLEKGQKITQETRGWDEAKQRTTPQRGKEEAHDYRYMPEPDIPPIELSQDYIADVKDQLPRLPKEWRKILNKLSIPEKQADILLDADVENDGINFLMFIEDAAETDESAARQEANLMVNVEIPLMREKGPAAVPQRAKWDRIYQPVIELINNNKLNSNSAKQLLRALLEMREVPSDIDQYAQDNNFIQVSIGEELERIVVEVLADNPKAAADVKAGRDKAIGFLVGQVMKSSGGRANPAVVTELIKKQLQ